MLQQQKTNAADHPKGQNLLTSSVWGLSRPVSYPAIAETRGNDTVEGVDVAQEERVDGAVATGRLLPASCPKGRRAFHQDLRSHSRSWIKRTRSPSARRTHGAKQPQYRLALFRESSPLVWRSRSSTRNAVGEGRKIGVARRASSKPISFGRLGAAPRSAWAPRRRLLEPSPGALDRFCPLLSQSRSGGFGQMRNRLFLFRRGRGFLNIVFGGCLLRSGHTPSSVTAHAPRFPNFSEKLT